jgi:hypothetical protein
VRAVAFSPVAMGDATRRVSSAGRKVSSPSGKVASSFGPMMQPPNNGLLVCDEADSSPRITQSQQCLGAPELAGISLVRAFRRALRSENPAVDCWKVV